MSTSLAPGVASPEVTAAQKEEAVNAREASLVLWLTNISHACNHFQGQMVTALYPVLMAELGFGYAQLGLLTAIRNLLGSATQISYGFLTPFLGRTWILGLGNFGIAIGTVLSGLAGSFAGFTVARSITAAASSAQHPVGASLLSTYFPRRRGMILALNNSIASVGGLLAPAVAAGLMYFIGWRQVFFVVAVVSVVIGVAYFLFGDRVAGKDRNVTGKARLARGGTSYLRVMKNRNVLVISLVMMVGAAGRGEGISTYLGVHIVNDLGLSLAIMGIALTVMQVGNIIGPVAFGWLSDRFSRKGVLTVSLLLSSAASFWLAYQGAYLPMLFLSLVSFSAVTSSRNSLTQALIADAVPEQDRDAGFSLYYFVGFISEPLWALLGGVLMQEFGFELAFSRVGLSYLVGMALMFFVVDPRSRKVADGAPT
jgi:MFS transporter, FSR family, fosmidomycin resistance protein